MNIKKPRRKLKKLKHNERINRFDFEQENDDDNNSNNEKEEEEEEEEEEHNEFNNNIYSDYDEQDVSEYSFKSNSDEWLFEKSRKKNQQQHQQQQQQLDYEDQDNNIDDEELRDQLDMHSMILVKSIYNDDDENEEN